MKISLKATYHTEDDNEPYVCMDMLSKNQRSIWFRLWWLLSKWKQTTLILTITKRASELVGPFTIEAHAESVSEDYAEVLATRLAALGLTVWIKGGDRSG